MRLLAFDSKEYIRRKLYQIENVAREPILVKDTLYYTPIGVGVTFNDNNAFRDVCLKRIQEVCANFQLPEKRIMYDSTSLKEMLTPAKAIPFCDQLVTKLKRYIESIYFSYVVMPPQQHPTVQVGGNKCPTYEIKSAEFLRNLGPMYSHIAAWSYFGVPRDTINEIYLDGFNSKMTYAWSDLLTKTKVKIFPHGDECNPYIMIADNIAFLTDAKLYIQRKDLRREHLQEIWEPYGFHVESHFLDYDGVGRYGWHSEQMIDTTPYLAHPIIFLLADSLEMLQPNPPFVNNEEENRKGEKTQEIMENITEESRFRKLVRRMEPWYAVTAYAYSKKGSAMLFNYYTDRGKVQDGDSMVYIGNKSQEMAQSFNDFLEVEVLSAKEVRKKVNRLKGNSETH